MDRLVDARRRTLMAPKDTVAITRIDNTAALADWLGKEVGVSDWLEVSQDRINLFAEATEDRQWIHLDVERAESESPFGTTIAHGFLSLSLISELLKRAIAIGGIRIGINYGLNRVRFVSPVPSGARVRGRFTLAALEPVMEKMSFHTSKLIAKHLESLTTR